MQGRTYAPIEESGDDNQTGWRAEVIPRHGRYLIIIYRDGDSIGQLQVETKEDMELWKNLVEELNQPKKKEQK